MLQDGWGSNAGDIGLEMEYESYVNKINNLQ